MGRARPRKAKKPKRGGARPRTRDPADDLVDDTAAVFTCSKEIAGDFAYQCRSRAEELVTDLAFARVALDIWRDQPGQGPALVELLGALAAERERHLAANLELGRRFEELAAQDVHQHLDPAEKVRDLIRQRLFPGPSPAE